MGNQPSGGEGPRSCEVPDPTGHVRRSIQVHLSEEDYLPMTLDMKQSMLAKNKFERIVPSKTVVEESRRTEKEEITSDKLDRGSKQSDELLSRPLEIERDDEEFFVRVFNVEPVVTVVGVTPEDDESEGRLRPGGMEEKTTTERLSETFKKSPTTTNRRFSLIDINTGVKKSRFTLELEDRLRQSKFELGFDDELDNWKEFNYAMELPDNKDTSYTVHKEKVKSASLKSFSSRKNVCPKEHVQYCTHNCQILRLCSVGRTKAISTLEPAIFDDEYDVTQLMGQRKDVKKHPKREDCDCDLCTLAYLTCIDVPGDCDNKVRCSVEEKQGKEDEIRERIKIIDKGDVCKSLEVSVSNSVRNKTMERRLYISNPSSSKSNMTGVSIEEDITNYRIKRKFRNNSPTAFRNVYSNYNQSFKDVSIVDLPTADEGCTRLNNRQTADPNWVSSLAVNSSKSDTRKSSASTLGASVSSSLSTIMSYKRVRQIFQAIIEKNRSRKRTKRNIHKFKEMEDLGLGEVKNNRWYPSDSKTLSIWRDMHSSMQGVQAQFKKYHRMSPRSKQDK